MAEEVQDSLSPAASSYHDASHRRHDSHQGSLRRNSVLIIFAHKF
ncbi:hypothetical protein A2U01_0082304, partial [Trifolium medium]|nr:hypothetical protein [Trifolium medium]